MSSSTSMIPVMTPRQTMRGHTGWVHRLVHLPGGQHIITGSLQGSLRVWDLESGTQTGEDWRDGENEILSMALSPNGKTIASGGSDYDVKLWDVETGKVMSKWTKHTYVVWALCWSADSERVASGSWNGTIKVLDVKRGKIA